MILFLYHQNLWRSGLRRNVRITHVTTPTRHAMQLIGLPHMHLFDMIPRYNRLIRLQCVCEQAAPKGQHKEEPTVGTREMLPSHAACENL